MLSVILILIAFSAAIKSENICQITVPIGQWFQNNTRSCEKVKGHFILDETANNFTQEIFSTFKGLKSIEGCLYVKGFNGSNNLSFFGNLTDVVCKQKQAADANLLNVIYVLGPFLQTMGFNSLTMVEGPGEIILSYEEKQKSYYFEYSSLLPVGIQCFFKKEMLFLARHPQFKGKMYQPCEVDDPCFKLDYFHRYEADEVGYEPYWYYTVADIPENCSTFVGVISITGPYEYKRELFDKFKNLSLLIGQIHVMGTLLDTLKELFPNLQNVYPYELPRVNRPPFSKYSGDSGTISFQGQTVPIYGKEALQIVRVRLNRFMTNMSLPSLLPTRPLDISNPTYTFPPTWFYYPTYFPDTIPDPCSHFPQFDPKNCGKFYDGRAYPYELDTTLPRPYEFITWLVAIISTAIGVAFSLRTMILLQFSTATSCLPYSRYFLIFSIFISTFVAMESAIIYQKFYDLIDGSNRYQVVGAPGDVPQILSEFVSPILADSFPQFIMTLLVSTKHTCLVLLILCYIDLAIFYRINKSQVSLCLVVFSTIFAILLCSYLHSQLFITYRGREPSYSREPRHAVYMPFIMNVASSGSFSKLVPSTSYIPCIYELLDFTYGSSQYFHFNSLTFEIHGNTFPDFVNVSDSVMVVVAFIFYLLTFLGFIQPHNKFIVLLLLYLQLSANRLRGYIYDILLNDYCLRADLRAQAEKDIGRQQTTLGAVYNCYTEFSGLFPYADSPAIMDESDWAILEKIIEKLPYLTFFLISLYCWKFAKYESYLGPALRYREKRSEPKKTGCDLDDPSDIRL